MLTLDQLRQMTTGARYGSSTPGDRQSYVLNPETGQYELAYAIGSTGTAPRGDIEGNYYEASPDYQEVLAPASLAQSIIGTAQSGNFWQGQQYTDLANSLGLNGLNIGAWQGIHPMESPSNPNGGGLGGMIENAGDWLTTGNNGLMAVLAAAGGAGAFNGMFSGAGGGAAAGAGGASGGGSVGGGMDFLDMFTGGGDAAIPYAGDPSWGSSWAGSLDNPGSGLAGMLGPQGMGLPTQISSMFSGGGMPPGLGQLLQALGGQGGGMNLGGNSGLLGALGSLFGIGSGVAGLLGGGQGGGPQPYQPTGQGGADQTYQQALQQLMQGTQAQTQATAGPLAQSYQQTLGINPQGYAQAGQAAGQQYGGLANMAAGYSGQLGAQGMDAINRGGALWQAGADPQRELYNRMQQQVTDQSRAGQAARGLTMGPYGAGLEQQALSNFDIDWRNNQLGRMLEASQGANQAGQLAGADLTGSMAFGAQVPQYTQQAGAAPIQGQMQAAQFPGQAASQYAQQVQGAQFAPQQQLMNQVIPYLSYGTGAGANAYNAFAGQQAFGAQQQQQAGQAIGQGLQQLGGNMNPGSWFGGNSYGGMGY